jgi:hypothetical protein
LVEGVVLGYDLVCGFMLIVGYCGFKCSVFLGCCLFADEGKAVFLESVFLTEDKGCPIFFSNYALENVSVMESL